MSIDRQLADETAVDPAEFDEFGDDHVAFLAKCQQTKTSIILDYLYSCIADIAGKFDCSVLMVVFFGETVGIL